jgi:hypothetical protein
VNTFVLEIWDDEGNACTFYTVRYEGNKNNETDRFILRYENDETHKESLQELLSLLIDIIGEDHGAKEIFFNRPENEVTALPPKGKINLYDLHYPRFPLRLYAYRLSEQIVILFSGGIKDAATNQQSSLSMAWPEACAFARAIDKAFGDSDIEIDYTQRKIISTNNEESIILYL